MRNFADFCQISPNSSIFRVMSLIFLTVPHLIPAYEQNSEICNVRETANEVLLVVA